MSTAALIDAMVIVPTLTWLGPPYDSPEANLLLVAIGQQESAFKTRKQHGGPARGYWQFEQRGGCDEFARVSSIQPFRNAARQLGFQTNADATYFAIGAGADQLACIMARGILWPDPEPLPARGDSSAAYVYYKRVWRPGKPSQVRWDASYATAMQVVPA